MATARARPNAADRMAAAFASVHDRAGDKSLLAQWRAQSELHFLRRRAAEELRRELGDAGGSTRSRLAAVDRALRAVRAGAEEAYGQVGDDLARTMREVAVAAHDGALVEVRDLFGGDPRTASPADTRRGLRESADAHETLGEEPAGWLDAQREDLLRRVRRELRVGVVAGEDDERLGARVAGERTGRTVLVLDRDGRTQRVVERRGGPFDRAVRDASAVVDSSVVGAAQASMDAVAEENSHLFRGVRAVTVLDGRTSKICIARTGAAWGPDGEPLPESTTDEPFPGAPPWHPNCRTTLAPIPKSREELLRSRDPRARRAGRAVPDDGSFDGEPGRLRSFDDFLEARGAAFARRRLGAAAYELWAAGRIDSADLLGPGGRPRTAEDLEREFG